MKKKDTIIKFILSIFITMLVVATFIFLLKVIKDKNQKVSIAMIALEEKIKEKEDAIIFSGKILEIKDLQSSVNNYFIHTDEIDIFVDYLEKLGADVGGELVVKNIEIPKETENTLSFKVSIYGTFDQVYKTIILLENVPYQVNVVQVYLNSNIKKEKTEKDKIQEEKEWQADVSFNILSLN